MSDHETSEIVSPDSASGRRDRRHKAGEERIIAAAREALLERTTADSLSLREVARRSALTPGAIYRYFDSRLDLLLALFQQSLESILRYIEPAVTGARGIERLRAVAYAYLAFGRDHPQDLALVFQSATHEPTWQKYVETARPVGLLVEAIHEDVEAGLLVLPEGLDEAGLAYAMWSLIHGMAELRRAHLRDVKGDFEAMQSAAIEHFLAPLTPISTGTGPQKEQQP
jgi:AcrR family transcriptional regulator